jgi:glycosyltransferase involved in cell wall biosynthesis
MTEMKVVFLLQDTRALYGAEQAMIRLVEGLVSAGISVCALLLQETRMGAGASPLAEALRRRIPVTDIPVAGRFSRTAIGKIRDFMAQERADVLHSTGYKADWHAGIASKWGALFPVVSTVHGWLFRWNMKERFFQAVNIHALRRFSRVIVLCDFYECYLRRCGLSPLQIAQIPTGVQADTIVSRADALQLWETPGEVFNFGLLGRLSAEKNHGLLLRAAVRLARDMDTSPRSWRILIAGDGPLRGKLQKQIERSGLSDRVALAGRMEPREFFRQVQVLVQCSRVENQPMSVMEAMAWMRPTIATGVGGLPELVRTGENGILVPKKNARALAAAMKEFLIAPEKARSTGLRARDCLEKEYPFDRMIRDHIGLYGAEGRH